MARWTFEVYSRLRDEISVTVFGFPTEAQELYPLRHESSGMWRVSSLLATVPYARRFEEPIWLLGLFGRLRRFDAIHIHNRPQWVQMLRNLGFKGVLILHLHNDHVGHWPTGALNVLASQVDAVVLCSDYLRRTFSSKSFALNAKSQVVFNGVDVNVFRRRDEARAGRTIFFVGRIDEQKGVLQLVQAFERVLDIHPEANLIIGGATGFGKHQETAYTRRVRDLALRLCEEKNADIQFTGYLNHDRDLPMHFQKATLFACPSMFQEPFGMVNVEAMACATPVVASNRGGIPEVVGDAGKLVNPENTREFADALAGLLSSPEECRRLGQAGYERCRELFDWNAVAKRWLQLVEAQVTRPRDYAATRLAV